MKTQVRVPTTIFILCIILFSLSAYAGEKVAVLDFKSILAPPELGVAVAEILRTELIGVGEYTVIERGMLEQILSEQELQLTGAVNSETAVEIGRLTGAKLVVIGSIVKTGSVYTINSRFIDVETGIAKVGQNIRGQGEDQISNMVQQLAQIIAGKTVTEEAIGSSGGTGRLSGESRLLFSFESEGEIAQWKPFAEPPKSMKRSNKYATEGDYSLHVVLPKKKEYPELDTTHSPKDWSSYQILAFDLYYKSKDRDEALSLGVRIDDPDSSPQNQRWYAEGFDLLPGPNTIRIEIERVGKKIDLTQVKRLMLFTEELDDEAEFYLDNVRFESREQAVQQSSDSTDAFVFSFEDKDEIELWQPSDDDHRIPLKQSKHYATHGSHSLEAKLPKSSSKNEYPGIYSRNFPEDWTPYRDFVVDVYWKQEKKSGKKEFPVPFTLRIDDAESDSYETRFNIDEFPLDPGQNEVRIPIGAVANVLDVSRIEEVHLFLIEPED
ncbi:MAG: hypothetical protein GY801_48455, partial [bacterium]|nr:hypothetical protein [bacterium]